MKRIIFTIVFAVGLLQHVQSLQQSDFFIDTPIQNCYGTQFKFHSFYDCAKFGNPTSDE